MKEGDRWLVRVVSPLPLSIVYYERGVIEFEITNRGTQEVVVDRVTLRFQADFNVGTVPQVCNCHLALSPGGSGTVPVPVQPTGLFSKWTNKYEMRLSYQVRGAAPETRECVVTGLEGYVILEFPKHTLGRLFISCKQPEDIELMNELSELGRRAGFDTWAAPNQLHTGEAQWKEIAAAIASSLAVAFIWTDNTNWTTGVSREVALTRRRSIRELALIETEARLPPEFQGSQVVYARFPRETPTRCFERVVRELREARAT